MGKIAEAARAIEYVDERNSEGTFKKSRIEESLSGHKSGGQGSQYGRRSNFSSGQRRHFCDSQDVGGVQSAYAPGYRAKPQVLGAQAKEEFLGVVDVKGNILGSAARKSATATSVGTRDI